MTAFEVIKKYGSPIPVIDTVEDGDDIVITFDTSVYCPCCGRLVSPQTTIRRVPKWNLKHRETLTL
jgi:hypothetical protein